MEKGEVLVKIEKKERSDETEGEVTADGWSDEKEGEVTSSANENSPNGRLASETPAASSCSETVTQQWSSCSLDVFWSTQTLIPAQTGIIAFPRHCRIMLLVCVMQARRVLCESNVLLGSALLSHKL